MSSVERDSLSLGFPYLLCYASIYFLCNGWTDDDEIFTPGAKRHADSKYDVRSDVLDPQPDNIQQFGGVCPGTLLHNDIL